MDLFDDGIILLPEKFVINMNNNVIKKIKDDSKIIIIRSSYLGTKIRRLYAAV